jgi:hypothetical protein
MVTVGPARARPKKTQKNHINLRNAPLEPSMSKQKYIPDKKKIHKLRKDLDYKNREAFAKAIEAYVKTLPPSPARIAWISARTIEDAESGKASTRNTLRAMASVLKVGWRDLLDPNHPDNQEALKSAPKSFRDCLDALLRFERSFVSAASVRVRAIAMDLSDTREWIPAAIERAAASALEFEVLALTGDTSSLPPDSPSSVLNWSEVMTINLKALERWLKKYRGGKAVSLQVKGYASIPTTHGVEVIKGDSRHYALSRCPTSDDPLFGFEWGRDAYRIFPHDDADTKLTELKGSFLELFDRHWNTPTPVLLDVRWTP